MVEFTGSSSYLDKVLPGLQLGVAATLPFRLVRIGFKHFTRVHGRVYTCLGLICLAGLSASAQDVSIGGLFPTIDHSGAFAKRFAYNTYLFAAIQPLPTSTEGADVRYLYAENGISYQLTPKLAFTAAYVYERQEPFDDDYRNEHRLFQQLTFIAPVQKFTIKQRLRFDERFIQNKAEDNYNFSSRLRYLAGANYDLSESLYLMGYSEFFFNTSKGQDFQFNENWSALQLGIRLSKIHAIEVGYLFVGWIADARQNWFLQHYLQTTWVSKFDFNKNK